MLNARIFLTLLIGVLFVPAAFASLTWTPGQGWSDESGSEASASSSSDQLDLAHNLEAKGNREGALKAYMLLVRRWPLSFSAPEAQFHIGKLEEDQADFLNAFKAFQKMVEKYPYSNYFAQALDEQYRIANLYLSGEPQKIWKIPMGPSMEKAISLFQQVIKNAPYGANAAQSQFNIGIAREKQYRYTDAVDAYQLLMDKYPTSDLASNAQYQIGYAWMKSAGKGDYDQSSAQKAIEAFQDFIVKYPDSDKVAQAQENITKLSQRRTEGAFNIAKFYESQHNPRAAYIYYNEVLKEDAASSDAVVAKKRIQELRPIVEHLPGGLDPAAAAAVVASNNSKLPSSVAPPVLAQPGDNTPPPPSTDPADTTLPKDPMATPGVAASTTGNNQPNQPDSSTLPPAPSANLNLPPDPLNPGSNSKTDPVSTPGGTADTSTLPTTPTPPTTATTPTTTPDTNLPESSPAVPATAVRVPKPGDTLP